MAEKTVFEVLAAAIIGEDMLPRVALAPEEKTPRAICRMPAERLVDALQFDPAPGMRAYLLQEAADFCQVWGNVAAHYEDHTTAQIRALLLELGGVDEKIADKVLREALGRELTEPSAL